MKVLIISGNTHYNVSGADLYARKLIEIIHRNFPNTIIDEYSYSHNERHLDEKNKIAYVNNIFPKYKPLQQDSKFKKNLKNIINMTILSRRDIKKIYHNYDLIIDGTLMLQNNKKMMKQNNYVYLQHQQVDFFKFKKYGFFCYLAKFLVYLCGFRNGFKLSKNLILYSKVDNIKYKNKNIFYIPNAVFDRQTIKNNWQKRKNILDKNELNYEFMYCGRIVKEQKRIDLLNKVAQKDIIINLVGKGSYINKLKNNPNVILHGYKSRAEICDIFQNSKFSILVSDYEGMANFLIESLSNGVPIISTYTSEIAKFLINDNNGFLLKAKTNKKEILDVIKKTRNLTDEQYKKMCYDSYMFALENLSLEKFEKVWVETIKTILNKK